MSKVRLVNSSGAGKRVTSLGTIEFDGEGLSKKKYPREDVLPLIKASASLSIEGEEKVIEEEIVEATKKKQPLTKSFTQAQVDAAVLKNAEELLAKVSLVTGIDQAELEAKLMAGVAPTPKNVQTQDLGEGKPDENPETKAVDSEVVKRVKDMKADDLRKALTEAGVDEKLWKDFKGLKGKVQLEELVIKTISEQS